MKTVTEPDKGYDLLPREEAALFVGATVRQLSRWTQQGKLRAYRPGNRVYHSRADLRAFMEASANRAEGA